MSLCHANRYPSRVGGMTEERTPTCVEDEDEVEAEDDETKQERNNISFQAHPHGIRERKWHE